MDDAELRTAKETTYLPKIVDCEPVDGHCIFRANFRGESRPEPPDRLKQGSIAVLLIGRKL